MKAARISGTENYADEAPELLKRYESISFADAHAPILQLIPPAPCRALDIGAGTGRDAAGLLALGHSVVAVEPTEELRRGAMLLHPSPMIEWLHGPTPSPPESALVGTGAACNGVAARANPHTTARITARM